MLSIRRWRIFLSHRIIFEILYSIKSVWQDVQADSGRPGAPLSAVILSVNGRQTIRRRRETAVQQQFSAGVYICRRGYAGGCRRVFYAQEIPGNTLFVKNSLIPVYLQKKGGHMVTINGEQKDAAGKSVLNFLKEDGYRPENVVVERNLEILERERLGSIILEEGDTVEILRFVGGG